MDVRVHDAPEQREDTGQDMGVGEADRGRGLTGQAGARHHPGVEGVGGHAGRQAAGQGVGEIDVGQLGGGVASLAAGEGLIGGGAPQLIDRSPAAQDPELAHRLWSVSEELTGVRSTLQPAA